MHSLRLQTENFCLHIITYTTLERTAMSVLISEERASVRLTAGLRVVYWIAFLANSSASYSLDRCRTCVVCYETANAHCRVPLVRYRYACACALIGLFAIYASSSWK